MNSSVLANDGSLFVFRYGKLTLLLCSCSPLDPSTSQTVCIRFIAVKDALHTIDIIQLVDLDTGFVTNLRNVLEIYVDSAAPAKQ